MWKLSSALIGCVLILVALGLVMLASTSGALGEARHGDPHYFVKRQVLWLAIGLCVGTVSARIDYHAWRKYALPLAALSIGLLVLVLIVGIEIKGSKRWLKAGPANFQPSELAKLALIILLSWWMARIKDQVRSFGRGLVVPMIFMSVFALLVFVEPDFGTAMLLGCVCFVILFIAGSRLEYLLVCAVTGGTAFIILIMENAERMRRVIAFMDPEKYARDEAFQLVNAIYAFVLGGGSGVGLGESLQKHFYLPEAHTDFIFAIIGEELGLFGSLLVVSLFLVLFILGIVISFSAQDSFGRFLGVGISSTIAMQAMINIGVVTGCLPTKGLALPFISSGGSHIVMSAVMMGILINIALNTGEKTVPMSDHQVA